MYTSVWWYLRVLPVLHRPEIVDIGVNTIPDKKRNAPLRTNQLSGKSQVIGQFSLYQCKGMPGTAASHVFCNLASKLCQRKLALNKVGVKL